MANIPSNSATPTPANNPPYPSTPPDESGFEHAYAGSQKAPIPHLAAEDEIDDWEKDEEEEDDWEDVAKRNTLHKQTSNPPIPESLRVGPPSGMPIRPRGSDNALNVASVVSLPISDLSSTVSLPLHPFNISDISSTVSLPQHPATLSEVTNNVSLSQQPPATSEVSDNVSLPQRPINVSDIGSNVSLQQPAPVTQLQTYNPFLRKAVGSGTGQSLFGEESPASNWDHRISASPATYAEGPLVELPASRTPTKDFLSTNLARPSPSYDAPIPVHTEISSQAPEVVANRPNRNDSVASSQYNPGMDISFMDAASSRGRRLSDMAEVPPLRTWQEQQEWERQQREKREIEAAQALERAQKAEQMRIAEEEYHRGEAESWPQEELAPPQPPRPQQQSTTTTSSPPRPSRATPEHYSIKKIRWYDTAAGELRTSPILTQNANGPCPLLALVNTMVLSTPPSEVSGLIEALMAREQVSLSLLLEAVFEELMTGRRSTSEQQLPDVSELYEFLKALHTGMNVNPSFVQVDGQRSHAPRSAPGGFETTKEMRLYSTFGIPLVHGWLPVLESPEYRSFVRSAATYEDAQNVQFHEEELEERLGTVGLSPREQDLFEDLHTIKSFLQTWPTQLTEYGLQTLHEHLPPGSFAILFRNDHFSTLYKEPRADQLMTLVTDAGYATHDEIIWESLVDVNGQGGELFSGDFRPVSHSNNATAGKGPAAGPRNSSLLQQGQNVQSMLNVGSETDGWTTVPGSRRTASTSETAASNSASTNPFAGLDNDPVGRSRTEQEDHDLALALQLQEEEEERVRQRDAERQREDRLSTQLLDGGGAGQGRGRGTINIPITEAGRPAIPPRRTQGQGRGATTHRPDDGSGDVPPPTYEQAASRPAFVPPEGHPANPLAPLPGAGGPQPQSGLAPSGGYRPPSAPYGAGRGYGMGRGMMAGGRDDRDKCNVM